MINCNGVTKLALFIGKRLFYMGLALLLTLPLQAQAKEVTLTTQLKNYPGDGAYLAIYLTDTAGMYQRTLWVAGGKNKHYKHLTAWALGSKMHQAEYDGMTGASISSGQTLVITVNVDDAFIDSGYQLRVDTAVEDLRENPADIVTPLTTAGAGKVVNGSGYVQSFKYNFK